MQAETLWTFHQPLLLAPLPGKSIGPLSNTHSDHNICLACQNNNVKDDMVHQQNAIKQHPYMDDGCIFSPTYETDGGSKGNAREYSLLCEGIQLALSASHTRLCHWFSALQNKQVNMWAARIAAYGTQGRTFIAVGGSYHCIQRWPCRLVTRLKRLTLCCCLYLASSFWKLPVHRPLSRSPWKDGNNLHPLLPPVIRYPDSVDNERLLGGGRSVACRTPIEDVV